WSGGPLAEGATLLVHAEQGHGDTIQFARFIPSVVRTGTKVVFEVHPALKPLYQDMSGVSIVAKGESLPPFDAHCPLLSLPWRLGLTLESIPDGTLTVPSERMLRWRNRLPADADPKIGIVWSGNPRFAKDRQRSMSLDRVLPIMESAAA